MITEKLTDSLDSEVVLGQIRAARILITEYMVT